jgi:hypothetical protein
MSVAAEFAAYLAASFFLSALAVRIAPRSWLGRRLRLRLWLFPAIPLLLPIAIAGQLGRLLAKCLLQASSAMRRSFELLSGHRTYRRVKYEPYYNRYGNREDLSRHVTSSGSR